jgi:hypothetical protein
MFVNPGSLLQLVIALLFSLFFLAASAWFQPYASPAANMFKVGSELALVMTLALAVMLRIDLSTEDIDVDTVGFLMLLTTTVVPGTTLVLGILTKGLGIKSELEDWRNFENPASDELEIE